MGILTHQRVSAVALALLAAGGLAACGDQPEGEGAPSATTRPPSTTTAEGGDPIKIGNISILSSPAYAYPQIETGLNAAVEEINANGGVDGRELEVVVCNDKFDPNIAITCAQQMVEEEVAAVVGSNSGHVPTYLPILEEAGIPFVANQGASEIEYINPISYPVWGATVGGIGGAGRYVADHGGKNVTILRVDHPSADPAVKLMTLAAEAGGASVNVVEVAADATDFAPAAATVLESNPDGVALAIAQLTVPTAVGAFRRLGFEGPIAMTLTYLSDSTIEAMGEDAVGLVGVADVLPVSNTTNPFIAGFISALENEDPEVDPDQAGLRAYLGVKFFAQAIEGLESVTAADVIEHLDNFEGTIEFNGVAPAWSGIPDPPPYPDFPRLAEASSYAMIVGEDGTLKAAGEPYDPLAPE